MRLFMHLFYGAKILIFFKKRQIRIFDTPIIANNSDTAFSKNVVLLQPVK